MQRHTHITGNNLIPIFVPTIKTGDPYSYTSIHSFLLITGILSFYTLYECTLYPYYPDYYQSHTTLYVCYHSTISHTILCYYVHTCNMFFTDFHLPSSDQGTVGACKDISKCSALTHTCSPAFLPLLNGLLATTGWPYTCAHLIMY